MSRCFVTGCKRKVVYGDLMCRPPWSNVPAHLQEAVYDTYRPGQERDKNPSREWVKAATAAKKSVSGRPDERLPL